MSGQDFNTTDDLNNYEDATSVRNNSHHHSEGSAGAEGAGAGAATSLGRSADNYNTLASASDTSLSAVAKSTLNAAAAGAADAGSASSPVVTQQQQQGNALSSSSDFASPPPPPSSTNSSSTVTSSSPLHQSQTPQLITPATVNSSSTTTTAQPPAATTTKALSPKQAPPVMNQYGSSSSGVSDLKLRRFLEHNQRLREQLEMRRIPVSEAGRSLIQYVSNTQDGLLPMVWGPPDPDPFASPSKGCCIIS